MRKGLFFIKSLRGLRPRRAEKKEGYPLPIFVFLVGEHLTAPAFVGASYLDSVASQFFLFDLLESNLCGATAVGTSCHYSSTSLSTTSW